MSGKIVTISGGFDPLRQGHLNLIDGARRLGNKLVCIVNDDSFLARKKGKPFYPTVGERKAIMEHIKGIDEVVISIDKDDSVCKTLELIQPDIFANGGDQKNANDIREKEVCERLGIKMVFNVGGDKISSSSDLTKGKRK